MEAKQFFAALALVGALTPMVAHGQYRPEASRQSYRINDSFYGEGRINRSGGEVRLRQASVDLRSDGTASVTFVGSKSWTYTGRWRDQGRDNYEIRISTAYGDRYARGSVLVGVDNGRVTSLRINDGYASGARFSGLFVPDRRSGGGNGYGNDRDYRGGIQFSASEDGRGGVVLDRSRRSSLTSARVSLSRDGTFSISTSRGVVRGSYDLSGRTNARLQIREAFGLRNVRGSGTVVLSSDQRRLISFDITGTSSSGSWNADFRTEDGRPGYGRGRGNDDHRDDDRYDDRGRGRGRGNGKDD